MDQREAWYSKKFSLDEESYLPKDDENDRGKDDWE